MFKKLIISFEGIEGSGKSLHLKNVKNFFKKKKIPFISLREPGGSKNSKKRTSNTQKNGVFPCVGKTCPCSG